MNPIKSFAVFLLHFYSVLYFVLCTCTFGKCFFFLWFAWVWVSESNPGVCQTFFQQWHPHLRKNARTHTHLCTCFFLLAECSEVVAMHSRSPLTAVFNGAGVESVWAAAADTPSVCLQNEGVFGQTGSLCWESAFTIIAGAGKCFGTKTIRRFWATG